MTLDESLRALQQKWRLSSNATSNDRWDDGYQVACEDHADELAALLTARQEVAPVTNDMVLAAADAFVMHQGCADGTVSHGAIRAALEAVAKPSHAQTSQELAPVAFDSWFSEAFPLTDLEADDGDARASGIRSCARSAWCAGVNTTGQTSDARDGVEPKVACSCGRAGCKYDERAYAAMQEAGK